MRRLLCLLSLAALLPATASALTVQDVVALSKAGVSEAVLLTLIDRDKTIFAIDPNQLIALKREGVSEEVVIAMLRSGRQEPPPAPATVAGAQPAAGELTIVSVGHGPDRPNTYHELDWIDAPRALAYTGLVAPYLPVAVPAVPWVRQIPSCAAVRRGSVRSAQDAKNCTRPR